MCRPMCPVLYAWLLVLKFQSFFKITSFVFSRRKKQLISFATTGG